MNLFWFLCFRDVWPSPKDKSRKGSMWIVFFFVSLCDDALLCRVKTSNVAYRHLSVMPVDPDVQEAKIFVGR